MRSGSWAAFAGLLMLVLLLQAVRAADPASLLDAKAANMGWSFGNGAEFPGATGNLSVDADAGNALKLDGDFSKGGKYVQAQCALPKLELHELSFRLKDTAAGELTMRLVDATGQCHQIKLQTKATTEWQDVRFPLADFFVKKGTPDAVGGIIKYETWGGDKDGRWHGPGKALVFLLSPVGGQKVRTLWLADVKVVPEAPAAPRETMTASVRLDEVLDDEVEWNFSNGQEFPGAKGAITIVKDEPIAGQSCLKLSGDFTKGGAYVETTRDLKNIDMTDLVAIHLKVKSDNVKSLGVRLVDATGQCHQAKRFALAADGQWHDLVLRPSNVAGGEHWGGANDGKWHGPATLVSLMLAPTPEVKEPAVLLAAIEAQTTVSAIAQASSFQEGFEAAAELPAGWTAQGTVGIDAKEAFKGKHALVLTRDQARSDNPCSATGPAFDVAPGTWQIRGASKSELHSPDSSYNGTVALEQLDATGKVLSSATVAEVYGTKTWQPFSQQVEVARGVAKARFTVQLKKADGTFWLDEISAAFLATGGKKDGNISRIVFTSAQLGNLLLPEDARTFAVEVDAKKPLEPKQMDLTWVLRDYWGAEMTAPAKAVLTAGAKSKGKRSYHTNLDLSSVPLEMGKYYELHAEIVQEGTQPFHNYTSFAILPLAVTKAYKPLEIPFTTRAWDNRIGEYLTLSDRLGIRIGGIWGGWSSTPPYKPEAPALELCKKLDMGVLTGTPIASIEHHGKGYEKYDETALRQGVRNWIEKYGQTRPLIFDLGNEPHGSGPTVAENVKAYKIVYEEIKKIDPSIIVLASSMGPEEEYFKEGFQNYCDAFDFHIYEDSSTIRTAFAKYHEMFKKYGCEKPVWSTELGLNAQGMTRQAVAVELYKKTAIFFASGGRSMSWFDILYPDAEGKDFDSSGAAFNVFDCRYVKYCPKLDAIAYYNAVNAICIKKFIAEKQYDGGISAFLFRDKDGRNLQMLWKDKGRVDVTVPLPGIQDVQLIAIDGRRSTLQAAGSGITLTISEDPLLLLYQGENTALATSLSAPAASITVLPTAVIKGDSVMLGVSLMSQSADGVSLVTPPFWTVKKSVDQKDRAGAELVTFALAAPNASLAREGNLVLPLKDAAGVVRGELSARIPLAGRLAIRVLPEPTVGGKPAGVKLIIRNNANEQQQLAWKMELVDEYPMKEGHYEEKIAPTAYFSEAFEGKVAVDAGQLASVSVPLAGLQSQSVYRVKATITDATGRVISQQRFVAGFAAVPRAKGTIQMNGVLDEPEWATAPVQAINEAKQVRAIDAQAHAWKGMADLSGKLQFLWDDHYLYVGATVTDDVFANTMADSGIWAGDGLQFLFDPARESAEKPGKYDYAVAVGKKGPQAWSYLSADPAAAPAGECKDILVSTKAATDGSGGVTYKIAIPWSRLSPFKPLAGGNLGLSMVLNEDDGAGRHGFMAWYGDPHGKLLDFVGDLVLGN